MGRLHWEELHELKRCTVDLAEAFEAHSGKRPVGLYRWDLDCLLAVIALALKDQRASPTAMHCCSFIREL